MINIGSNKFENVAIPLIFQDRYFLLEQEGDQDVFTVFTFHKGQPTIEVLKNEPVENPITKTEKNATGIITVSDPISGAFLYKIRPGSKDSSIFGTMGAKEEEIRIRDREITFRGNVFSENMFINIPVGIHIGKDGSVGLGAQFPPEFMQLLSGGSNLIRHESKTFENEKIRVDGNEYIKCKFLKCELQYGGMDAVGFNGCDFHESNWVFVEAADRTIGFITALYHGMGEGGKKLVEQTFENIRKGQHPKKS